MTKTAVYPLLGFVLPTPNLEVGYAVPVYEVDKKRKIQAFDPDSLNLVCLIEFAEDEKFVAMEDFKSGYGAVIIKDRYLKAGSVGSPAVLALWVGDQMMVGTKAELQLWVQEGRNSLDLKLSQFPTFRKDIFEFLDVSESVPIPKKIYPAFTRQARSGYDVRHHANRQLQEA